MVSENGNEFDGSCHCGNIGYRLLTGRKADELPLRRCGCSFCRRVGARYTSDPQGELHIRILDPAAVSRYRFASEVVEFLVCARCGCMPVALCQIDGGTYAVINANTLNTPLDGDADLVDFSAGTPQEGKARRRRNWIGRVTVTTGAAQSGD